MKPSWLVMLLVSLFGMAVLSAAPGQAQECPNDDCEQPALPEVQSGYDPTPPVQTLSAGNTRAIVRILDGASTTCDRRIDLRYRIDCLRIYYGWVAASLPDTGDYAPIKQAMLDAEAKLDAIVRANLDDGAPAIRPREKHKLATKRMPPVRAVAEDRAEIAAAQAAKVIEETELIILRSGGDPARRTEHYKAVAAAVEDNLVILRSA